MWKWVTTTILLSPTPCEVTMIAITSGASAASVTLYDGHSTSGEVILVLEASATITQQIHLLVPIYCTRGLYVVPDSNATGVFVQWRGRLDKKEEG